MDDFTRMCFYVAGYSALVLVIGWMEPAIREHTASAFEAAVWWVAVGYAAVGLVGLTLRAWRKVQ